MATIVMTIWPAFGHLNPTLKLARKLRRTGHRVCYLGLPEFERYIISQGFEFFAVLSEVGRFDRLFKATALDASVQIEKALHRIRPDLLIIDSVLRDFAGIAYKLRIPSLLVAVSLDEVRFPIFDTETAGSVLKQPTLVLCPAEFDFPEATKRNGDHHVEASIDLERSELRPFPWGELDESKPLIYCSLGSHSNQYGQSRDLFLAVIDAIERKPEWQLILATGRGLIDQIDLHVPANALVVEWAPQLKVLKKSSIMITHGGLGSLKECIYFGVPMIVYPMMFDQKSNAARVAYHGIGVQGNSDMISRDQILSFIELIQVDGSFKMKITSMSRIFKEAEESSKGVQIIEAMLGAYSNIS
jgi:UDP:flavonoid glycosyltransferase YjiC (YdhE family)